MIILKNKIFKGMHRALKTKTLLKPITVALINFIPAHIQIRTTFTGF